MERPIEARRERERELCKGLDQCEELWREGRSQIRLEVRRRVLPQMTLPFRFALTSFPLVRFFAHPSQRLD